MSTIINGITLYSINSAIFYIKEKSDGTIIGSNNLAKIQNDEADTIRFPVTVDYDNCQIVLLSNITIKNKDSDYNEDNDVFIFWTDNIYNFLFWVKDNNVTLIGDNFQINVEDINSYQKYLGDTNKYLFNGVFKKDNNVDAILNINNLILNIINTTSTIVDGWLIGYANRNVNIVNFILTSTTTIEEDLLLNYIWDDPNGNYEKETFKKYNGGVGSIIGTLCENINFTDCINYFDINISSDGSFCKKNCKNLNLNNCISFGEINGDYSGGFCGSNCNNIIINKSYTEGNINGYESGGFLGKNCFNCEINNGYSNGAILGKLSSGVCGLGCYNIKIKNFYVYSTNIGTNSGIIIGDNVNPDNNIQDLSTNIESVILQFNNIILQNFYKVDNLNFIWSIENANNYLIGTPKFNSENIGTIWVSSGQINTSNTIPYILKRDKYNYSSSLKSFKYGNSKYETSEIVVNLPILNLYTKYFGLIQKTPSILPADYDDIYIRNGLMEYYNLGDNDWTRNYILDENFKILINNLVNVNNYSFNFYSKLNLFTYDTILVKKGLDTLSNPMDRSFLIQLVNDNVLLNDKIYLYAYNNFYLETNPDNNFYYIYLFNSRSKYKKYISSNIDPNIQLRKNNLTNNKDEALQVELIKIENNLILPDTYYYLKWVNTNYYFNINNSFTRVTPNGGGSQFTSFTTLSSLPSSDKIFYKWKIDELYYLQIYYNASLNSYLYLENYNNDFYIFSFLSGIKVYIKLLIYINDNETTINYTPYIFEALKFEYVGNNNNNYRLKTKDYELYLSIILENLNTETFPYKLSKETFIFNIYDISLLKKQIKKSLSINNINVFKYNISPVNLVITTTNQQGIYNNINNFISQTAFTINNFEKFILNFKRAVINVIINGNIVDDLNNVDVGIYRLNLTTPYYDSDNNIITRYIQLNFLIKNNNGSYLIKKESMYIKIYEQWVIYGEEYLLDQNAFEYDTAKNDFLITSDNELKNTKIYYNNNKIVPSTLVGGVYPLSFYYDPIKNYNVILQKYTPLGVPKSGDTLELLIIFRRPLYIFLNNICYVGNSNSNIVSNNRNNGFTIRNSNIVNNDEIIIETEFYNPLNNSSLDTIPIDIDFNEFNNEKDYISLVKNLFVYTIRIKSLKINGTSYSLRNDNSSPVNKNGYNIYWGLYDIKNNAPDTYTPFVYFGNTFIDPTYTEIFENTTIENFSPLVVNNMSDKNIFINFAKDININDYNKNILLINSKNIILDFKNFNIDINSEYYKGLILNTSRTNSNIYIQNLNLNLIKNINYKFGSIFTNTYLIPIKNTYDYIENNYNNQEADELEYLKDFLLLQEDYLTDFKIKDEFDKLKNRLIESNFNITGCSVIKNNYFINGNYQNININTIIGNGSGAEFDIKILNNLIKKVEIINGGNNYNNFDKLSLPENSLGDNSKETIFYLTNNSVDNGQINLNNYLILNTDVMKYDGKYEYNMSGTYNNVKNYQLTGSLDFTIKISITSNIVLKKNITTLGNNYNIGNELRILYNVGIITYGFSDITLENQDEVDFFNNVNNIESIIISNLTVNTYDNTSYDIAGIYENILVETLSGAGSGSICNAEVIIKNYIEDFFTNQQNIFPQYKKDEIIILNLSKTLLNEYFLYNCYTIKFFVKENMLVPVTINDINGNLMYINTNKIIEFNLNSTLGTFGGGLCGFRTAVGNQTINIKNNIIKINIDNDDSGGISGSDTSLLIGNIFIEENSFSGNIITRNSGCILGSNFSSDYSIIIIKNNIIEGELFLINNGFITGGKVIEVEIEETINIGILTIENNRIIGKLSEFCGGFFGFLRLYENITNVTDLIDQYLNTGDKIILEYNLNFFKNMTNNFIYAKYDNNKFKYYGVVITLDVIGTVIQLLIQNGITNPFEVFEVIIKNFDNPDLLTLSFLDIFIDDNKNFSYRDYSDPLVWLDKYTYNNLIYKTIPLFDIKGNLLNPFGTEWTKISFTEQEPWNLSILNLKINYNGIYLIIGNEEITKKFLFIPNSEKYEIKDIIPTDNNNISIDENNGDITIKSTLKPNKYDIYIYTSITNNLFYNYTKLILIKIRDTLNLTYFLRNSNVLIIQLPIVIDDIDIDYEYIFVEDLKKGFIKQINKNTFNYYYKKNINEKDTDTIKYKFNIIYRNIKYSSKFSNIEIIIN
jgi:hypothetical protein